MLSVIALAAVVAGGSADEGRQLHIGARVRVLIAQKAAASIGADSDRAVVGRLSSLRSDSLTLDRKEAPLVVSLEDVVTLEVSRRGRNLRRGAFLGGLIGFVAVTAVCIAVFDAEDDFSISTGDSFALGALFGAPGGGLIGLTIGAITPAWQAVPVPGAAVSKAGLSLSLKISF